MYSAFTPQWHLDILSADSFPNTPQAHSRPAPAEQPSQVLLGGLVPFAEQESKRQNADNKGQPAPRSRRKKALRKGTMAKVSPSGTAPGEAADEVSRKRGRPRVHAADETATERRRTQIRLAQRAYRLRKEAVITSLSERVEQLEYTIEEMSKTFLAFNDDALSSGILSVQPDLAQKLRRTTQRFLTLASDISRGSDEESVEEAESGSEAQKGGLNEGKISSISTDVYPAVNSVGIAAASFGSRTAPFSKPVANTSIYPQNTSIIPDTLNSVIENNTFLGYRALSNEESQFMMSSPSSLPRELSPHLQYTYSFQETSFSRRLHRRCVEFGYAALTNPSCNPDKINYTFRFTFGIITRERLVRAFHYLLQRKAGEPLEFWNKPFFYIGGAGMHYPHEDEFGNVIFPPNMHPPERAFGPLPLHDVERPHQFKSVDEIIDAIGFGGDWFDCHDVEGYLCEKGIRLNSRSSYILIPSSAVTPHASSINSPATNSPGGSHDADTLTLSHRIANPESQPEFAMSTTHPLSETYYPFQNEVCSQMMGLLGLAHDPTLRLGGPAPSVASHSPSDKFDGLNNPPSLLLDVDNFVTQLCHRAVCLGRAPGIRKHDVDAALALSVTKQY
ncbi:hypothetical protein PRK78_005375 [Emydomyces testavorans]|uniref:BZIP domain-containing protein n=1 Tax=Emydomyces testavorans TaxID=2070801 RepID=A0AAF0IMJ2_9EURO|nr:hypothetical protein PRK78_005375 [Emydomyces testavorans]